MMDADDYLYMYNVATMQELMSTHCYAARTRCMGVHPLMYSQCIQQYIYAVIKRY